MCCWPGEGERFSSEAKLFLSLSYKSVLARGFAVVRDDKMKPLQGASAVRPGQRIAVEFSDGSVSAVTDREPGQGRLF